MRKRYDASEIENENDTWKGSHSRNRKVNENAQDGENKYQLECWVKVGRSRGRGRADMESHRSRKDVS
jgi:hypothetical protein